MRLKLGREGESSPNGGPPGDLYVEIFVEPHEFFEREGDDVTCHIPISFADAALGATMEIPTLEDFEKISIKGGTQPGDMIRLRGKGVHRLRGHGRGDQIIFITVQTPTKLTKRQKELLREFARLERENTN